MKRCDRKILEAMIDQMNASTARADAALDRALEFVAESEKRIDATEVPVILFVDLDGVLHPTGGATAPLEYADLLAEMLEPYRGRPPFARFPGKSPLEFPLKRMRRA